jgi:hypothetical protein
VLRFGIWKSIEKSIMNGKIEWPMRRFLCIFPWDEEAKCIFSYDMKKVLII